MKKNIFFIILLALGCGQRTEKKAEIILSKSEIEELLKNWKKDSVGCLRLRDPDKMMIYAKQLVGRDSFELVRELGPPNFRYDGGGQRHFQYFLMCGTEGTSYFNFNFHFAKDTIDWFSNPVH